MKQKIRQPMNRKIYANREEWISEAKRLFGEDPEKWVFECVICKNKQSIESVLQHNSSLDRKNIPDWIYFSCEGRFTKGQGCDWTLGGLFHVHEAEVLHEGESMPVFLFGE